MLADLFCSTDTHFVDQEKKRQADDFCAKLLSLLQTLTRGKNKESDRPVKLKATGRRQTRQKEGSDIRSQKTLKVFFQNRC